MQRFFITNEVVSVKLSETATGIRQRLAIPT